MIIPEIKHNGNIPEVFMCSLCFLNCIEHRGALTIAALFFKLVKHT